MPVLEQLAAEYPGVTFLAVAGRSDLGSTRDRAVELGLDDVAWAFDQELWERYRVRSQPTAFLITADDKIYEGPWFRVGSEDVMRQGVEDLIALHG